MIDTRNIELDVAQPFSIITLSGKNMLRKYVNMLKYLKQREK